ncbi:hypothetical protein ABK040_011611 [Willaertia magna]
MSSYDPLVKLQNIAKAEDIKRMYAMQFANSTLSENISLNASLHSPNKYPNSNHFTLNPAMDQLNDWKDQFNEKLSQVQEEMLLFLTQKHMSKEELSELIKTTFSGFKISVSDLLGTMTVLMKKFLKKSKKLVQTADEQWESIVVDLNNQLEYVKRQRAIELERQKELEKEVKHLRQKLKSMKIEIEKSPNVVQTPNSTSKFSSKPLISSINSPSTPRTPKTPITPTLTTITTETPKELPKKEETKTEDPKLKEQPLEVKEQTEEKKQEEPTNNNTEEILSLRERRLRRKQEEEKEKDTNEKEEDGDEKPLSRRERLRSRRNRHKEEEKQEDEEEEKEEEEKNTISSRRNRRATKSEEITKEEAVVETSTNVENEETTTSSRRRTFRSRTRD